LSSILRALKKLENEPRHLEETPPLGSKFIPLADTGPQKKAAAILMLVIGGSIVCGLVILAGWKLFSEKTQPPPDAPQNISRPGPPQQAETVPVTPKQSAAPDPAAPPYEPAQRDADIVLPPQTADNLPGAPPVKMVPPSPPALEQSTVLPVEEQAAQAATRLPAVPRETIEQAPADEDRVAGVRDSEAPAKVKKIEIPVLNDPEMKLQAITWSKDPQKRIAVINNRILRQGERVYGYHIDTINQDDVVLSDAGEKWKLLFRIK
jgi:general secretion pathway protein B